MPSVLISGASIAGPALAYWLTGTHRVEYMALAPTGKTVRYDEIFICRFANGRVMEIWGVVDVLSQMKQLGAIPGSSGEQAVVSAP